MNFFALRTTALVGLCLAAGSLFATAADPTGGTGPVITKIRGRNITVAVPAGYDSITLQTFRSAGRGKGKTWATVDTQFPQQAAKDLTFRVAKLTPKRLLRVLGSRTSPLPDSFLSGVTAFGSDSLSLSAAGSVRTSGNVGGLVLGNTAAGSTSLGTPGSGSGAPVSVVESDIWKVSGNRVYFFNQLRGLQVLDLTNPDDPALLGTLRMPASGEDLYLLDDTHVAVLKSSWNFWGMPFILGDLVTNRATGAISLVNTGISSGGTLSLAPNSLSGLTTTLRPYTDAQGQNSLVIADVSNGAPQQAASVDFQGSLRESRLVGNILYVATAASETTDTGSTQYGTRVTAFDVSDPANPTKRDSLFFDGWSSVVTATPQYFFIVTSDYAGGSQVHIVDISAGNGTLTLGGTATAEGYIADKFKIGVVNGALTVVSQIWPHWSFDGTDWTTTGESGTVIQTFSLANVTAPQQLGRLLVGAGESVRATRFDSSRLYVVTFEQIDPLHLIDLSDPANPTLASTVDAPGFSTYIEPLGDRLVSIGLVNWQPAVSLFDVSDAANPKLLQQVSLGGTNDGWSSSEAVWNEKAFKVLPEQNLILLPIAGVDLSGTDQWGGEWFSRVQLIDLFHDSLAKRGVIDSNFSPRRADVLNDRIVTISPSKLVTVNADDRDKPVVTADVELAWTVNRVFHLGDYLVEVGGSADWIGKPSPSLIITAAAMPDVPVATVDLDPLDIVGSEVRAGVLYLAQRAWPRWWISDAAENNAQLLVTAFDVSALPAIRKLSQASGPAPMQSWGDLTALWPSPGTLVWAAQGRYVPVLRGGVVSPLTSTIGTLTTAGRASMLNTIGFLPWFGGWSKELVAFNVGAPDKIVYASTFELKASDGASLADPIASAGLVFVSEQQWWLSKPDADNTDVGRHFLRVVEYSEPTAPFLRDERVNIPGRLIAVQREGKLLYTVGSDVNVADGTTLNSPALHASAFDGMAAHLIATQPLPSLYSPVRFAESNVFYLDEQQAYLWKWTPLSLTGGLQLNSIAAPFGSYDPNPASSILHITTLTDAGAFSELSSLEVGHDTGLHLFGQLAVTQPRWSSLRAIDDSNLAAPADLGSFSLSGNVYPLLDGADGSLQDGLWIPTGAYGVETLGFSK